MARTLTLDGRSVLEPKLRQDRRGLFYMRVNDPARIPFRKDVPLDTRDEGAAQVLFAQRRMEYLAGRLDPWAQKEQRAALPAPPTLKAAVDRYCEGVAGAGGEHVRESTRKPRRVRLEPFAATLPGAAASAGTAAEVRAYCLDSQLKPSTQMRYLAELRSFFAWCEREGLREGNPAAEVSARLPRHRKRERKRLAPYLTPDEVRAWLAAIGSDLVANPRHRERAVLADVVRLAVLTGLRRGELCRLRWADVTLYDPPRTSPHGLIHGWLSVVSTEDGETKTGDEERVPLVAAAAALLARRKAANGASRFPSSYVLPAPRILGMLDGDWVSKRFREYADQAGLAAHLHFHSLRHTCASWLAEAGVELRAIQAVMRHADLRQTLRYASLHPDVAAARMAKAFAQVGELNGEGANSSSDASSGPIVSPAASFIAGTSCAAGRSLRTQRNASEGSGNRLQYSLFENGTQSDAAG